MAPGWQKINEPWHHCHWWRHLDRRRITAMFEFFVFLAAVTFVAVIGAALRDIHDDDPTRSSSYVPPRSHPDDSFSPRRS